MGSLRALKSVRRVKVIIMADHTRCAHVRKKDTCAGIDFRKVRVPGSILSACWGIHPKKRREIGARRSSLRGRKKKDASAFRGLW